MGDGRQNYARRHIAVENTTRGISAEGGDQPHMCFIKSDTISLGGVEKKLERLCGIERGIPVAQ